MFTFKNNMSESQIFITVFTETEVNRVEYLTLQAAISLINVASASDKLIFMPRHFHVPVPGAVAPLRMEIKSLCFNIHANARVGIRALITSTEWLPLFKHIQSLSACFSLEPDFICPSAARNVITRDGPGQQSLL